MLCYQSLFSQVVDRPQVQKGLRFVFDEKKGVEGKLLERFRAARLAFNAEDWGYLDDCSFEDDRRVLPLQAADFLAYEVRRFVYQRITAPDRPERVCFSRLKQRQHCFRRYDKQFVEALVVAHNISKAPLDILWHTIRESHDD